jgi:hypothetical protein
MIRFDVMGPHVFGADGALAASAADLIGAVGFDALSLGIHDFGAARAVHEAYQWNKDDAALRQRLLQQGRRL